MKFKTGDRIVTNTFLVTTYNKGDEVDALPGELGVVIRYENDQICNVMLDSGVFTIAHDSELDHVH